MASVRNGGSVMHTSAARSDLGDTGAYYRTNGGPVMIYMIYRCSEGVGILVPKRLGTIHGAIL